MSPVLSSERRSSSAASLSTACMTYERVIAQRSREAFYSPRRDLYFATKPLDNLQLSKMCSRCTRAHCPSASALDLLPTEDRVPLARPLLSVPLHKKIRSFRASKCIARNPVSNPILLRSLSASPPPFAAPLTSSSSPAQLSSPPHTMSLIEGVPKLGVG